ncbi:MAG: metallophosphoesterase [Ferruginibacter sp.]|nr:metallophosphoesterase [Ferruginibacter sp.]
MRQLLLPGEKIPISAMRHPVVHKMLEDAVLQKQQISKAKALLFIPGKESMSDYLHNHFGISDLEEYINTLESEEQSRAGNVAISGNSKLQAVRTFKGFLINTYDAVPAVQNKKPIVIQPITGSYTYIYDYENFIPDAAVTIVGIENPENFRQIEKQRYLFANIQPLFVSRYPQSNDLVKWLSAIPNNYLHFGDLDFAGINIYQNEFKKHLCNKASFFIPGNVEALLMQYGNRELFNRQYNPALDYSQNVSPAVGTLVQLFLQHKKVLEQEVFINGM